MRVLRFFVDTIAVLAAALFGNWAGDRLRAVLTGQPGHQLTLSRTDAEGQVTVAADIMFTNYIPGVLAGLLGRPRALNAFFGGALASLLLSNRYEQAVKDRLFQEKEAEQITLADS